MGVIVNPHNCINFPISWHQSQASAALDPIHPHFTRYQARIEAMAPPRVEDPMVQLLAKIEEGNKMMSEMQSSMKVLENSVKKLSDEHDKVENWKPAVEATLNSLSDTIQDLKIKVEHFIHETSKQKKPQYEKLVDSGLPSPALLRSHRDAEAPG